MAVLYLLCSWGGTWAYTDNVNLTVVSRACELLVPAIESHSPIVCISRIYRKKGNVDGLKVPRIDHADPKQGERRRWMFVCHNARPNR